MTSVLGVELRERLPVVEVLDVRAHVLRLTHELDDLARVCGLPLTAGGAWTRAAVLHMPESTAWAVAVRGAAGPDGSPPLHAAAVLLDLPAEDGRTAVLAGSSDGHRGALLAGDERAALVLGDVLAAELRRRAGYRLGPLRRDAALTALASRLDAQPEAVDPVPALVRGASDDIRDYVTAGMRKTLRKSRNRAVTDGVELHVAFTRDPGTVRRCVPAMLAAYRDRDREHGLPCALDESGGLARWTRRVDGLLDREVVELATLTADGELAAYVLGLLDGDAYRVLEGRFVTRYARYAPGRLLEAHVAQRVLRDPAFERLDWMTSVAPETLIAANAADELVELRG